MILPKYNWHINSNEYSDEEKEMAHNLNINPLIVSIMFQRGYDTLDKIKSFLNPDINSFHDPFELHDMQKSVDRISLAITNNEKITIYGDYDADGITSTAILYETLQNMGANVNFYIPNRFTDGYGPNSDAYKRIINEGTTLIITVDNGVSGKEQVDLANSMNCDVIITDHHNLPNDLPNAYSIIHARYPNDEYEFGDLSGAGISFKLSTALLGDFPSELLDLVAIGTVADLVSLTDENRAIVKLGLMAIAQTERPGLSALINKAGLKLDNINEESIGFGIAPRLNALGRISDASVGVELLTTFDDDYANELAKETDSKNSQRKKLVSEIYEDAYQKAENLIEDGHKTLFIVGENWHEGVLGIVASRIVEKFNKPTLVLNLNNDTNIAKGSGRSIDGFDIFKALNDNLNNMVSFGGHSMAVGLSVNKDKISSIYEDLDKYADNHHINSMAKPNLNITGCINVKDINQSLFDDINKLAPFGTNNEYPIFKFAHDSVSNITTMGANNNHLKFKLISEYSSINVLAFNNGRYSEAISESFDALDIVGHLVLSTWKGRTSVQIMLDDFSSSGPKINDQRSRVLTKETFLGKGTYVFFNNNILQQVKKYIPNESKCVHIDDLSFDISSDNIIIVDCPSSFEQLKRIFYIKNLKELSLILYKKELISKFGMPNREQCAKIFKFFAKHNGFDLKQNLAELCKFLNIPKKSLFMVIKMFSELDFLHINDWVVYESKQPVKKEISKAPTYQKMSDEISLEKKLILSSKQELSHFIRNEYDKRKDAVK
ncbi:single-stranded-DNA-specific exonuclease RecJ [Apilactobacillus xinyiensis]|uniref:single-stranded-DNA-specific exonuclease RecJ n=1 Tax=Apilactobacillus xinyiensis TaxID=2841032 RepID=UPI00200E7749|nr:single-stranded-DNA-specific exonuclease RecJ [Apilactobacillus xinyiensis]MCL0329942.1 single-stranded-DNA-specific exonuclease RecJ [Apilactobacillus xinyiensis]